MKFIYKVALPILLALGVYSCTDEYKDSSFSSFNIVEVEVEGVKSNKAFNDVDIRSEIKLVFDEKIDETTIAKNIYLRDDEKDKVSAKIIYDGDKTITIKPEGDLRIFSKYDVVIQPNLRSTESDWSLYTGKVYNITTSINKDDKFPKISDEELLELVQKQTFKYFWEGGEPNSGMARERNSSGTRVTTGGTGFGVMAMIVAVERGFITRDEALARVQQIVTFLDTKAEKHQGAYSHWINGATGQSELFGRFKKLSDPTKEYKDNGADIVETALLFQGLLSAKSYFNGGGAEATLAADITRLYEAIEWSNFVQPTSKPRDYTIYWHWNAADGFSNVAVTGWNESLIVYVLAASSPTFPITKDIYDMGWARDGAMKNGKAYYEIGLPLGPEKGGPLFMSQYSFLGLNPKGLKDQYADYWVQNVSHTLINREHCIVNPSSYGGYGADVWGLTASDGNNNTYSAHSPSNDNGVIAPTAAISAMPYTPLESMQALRYFYYKLGDHTWGNYGFYDAFNLSESWFASGYIAIDQGTQIVMIENYRTGLIWKTFMALPEIQVGLDKLGFEYSVTVQ